MIAEINNILLIDDDNTTNYLSKIIIGDTGLVKNFHVALNGKRALDFISQRSRENDALPEIIFLDINMPIMDGWEFLEEYNKLSEPVKSASVIVMLSSSGNQQDRVRAAQNPLVREYTSKPLTFEFINELLMKYFHEPEIARSYAKAG